MKLVGSEECISEFYILILGETFLKPSFLHISQITPLCFFNVSNASNGPFWTPPSSNPIPRDDSYNYDLTMSVDEAFEMPRDITIGFHPTRLPGHIGTE